jgi:hypothetical protein
MKEGFPDFFSPPCEIRPTVDPVDLFFKVQKKYNHVPQKDQILSYLRIRYMGVNDALVILHNLLPNGKRFGDIYCDGPFKYCLLDHWGKHGHKRRGYWWSEASIESSEIIGHCIFSMVSFITGCSPIQAIEYVAEILKVPFSEVSSIQPNSIEGYAFIEQAHAYHVDGDDEVVKEVTSQILAPCHESYDFLNKYGANSISLFVWREQGEAPLQLFKTKQYCKDNDKYFDTFIAPLSWTNVIYNLNLIHEQNNDVVFIHDEIGRTKDWKDTGINTWSGELAYVSKIDWSILKGRNVQYVFDPKRLSSCMIGAELMNIFNGIGSKLEFIICDED